MPSVAPLINEYAVNRLAESTTLFFLIATFDTITIAISAPNRISMFTGFFIIHSKSTLEATLAPIAVIASATTINRNDCDTTFCFIASDASLKAPEKLCPFRVKPLFGL